MEEMGGLVKDELMEELGKGGLSGEGGVSGGRGEKGERLLSEGEGWKG